MTISSLTDDVYGNLDGKGTCDVPQTIAAGASYSCSFTGAVSGNAGSSHKDIVTASGTDDDGNPVSDEDDATVTITNVAELDRGDEDGDDPTSLPEPGGNATFSVKVENTSAVDSVTISSLTDDVYGNLDGKGTCDVPQTIAAGGSYSCSFTGGQRQRGQQHKDVVTASGTDDDGNPVSDEDDATVTITDVAGLDPGHEDRDPDLLPEPGGTRPSSRSRTPRPSTRSRSRASRTSLRNLDGKGTCDCRRRSPPAPATAALHRCGRSSTRVYAPDDDDGTSLRQDDAIVRSPTSHSIGTRRRPSLPRGTHLRLKVENTVDSVTISSLTDDVYGNLDGKGTCDVPQTLAPGELQCSFTGGQRQRRLAHKDVVTRPAPTTTATRSDEDDAT